MQKDSVAVTVVAAAFDNSGGYGSTRTTVRANSTTTLKSIGWVDYCCYYYCCCCCCCDAGGEKIVHPFVQHHSYIIDYFPC